MIFFVWSPLKWLPAALSGFAKHSTLILAASASVISLPYWSFNVTFTSTDLPITLESVTLYLSNSNDATAFSATTVIATDPTTLSSFLMRRYAVPSFTPVTVTDFALILLLVPTINVVGSEDTTEYLL